MRRGSEIKNVAVFLTQAVINLVDNVALRAVGMFVNFDNGGVVTSG